MEERMWDSQEHPLYSGVCLGKAHDKEEEYEEVQVIQWSDRTAHAVDLGKKTYYLRGVHGILRNCNVLENEELCRTLFEMPQYSRVAVEQTIQFRIID